MNEPCACKEINGMWRTKRDKLIPLEKSKRVIQLDKRGDAPEGHSVAEIIFGVVGAVCLLYCASIAIAGFGTYFFLIWAVLGGCCFLFCLMLHSGFVASMPKRFKKVCCCLFCAGVLLFIGVEAAILSQYGAKAGPGADYLVVLGAQWKGTRPSTVLRKRLDKAVEYLEENPETKVIVSGGQGGDESMTEAAGMREYLLQVGIREDRILVEDESRNTYENLVLSGGLLDRKENKVVIVTNNFHMFRALNIAKKQGYAHVEGLAADSVAGMGPNNLLREFLGVVKDFLVGNL